ncbi:hypothetical protein OSSY52_06930 [Tepiditoga spiralis]|uniref:Uncharacterized protein n=1 Tax=Tepiditoga spiralis TaxID=2108365 RepID=A0A7G1G909_9BACT|nr:hypothetical protein [Tepiditoga spiralis]BBE30552.1 hypothetical protein OSSY52_06930 [Tepiditoga spiralis]
MILLKPFIILIALIFWYIPYLQFIGMAIILFVYHTLIKNRNEHIKKMKEIYNANNWDFPIKNIKMSYIPFILYIISALVIAFLSIDMTNQLIDINPSEYSKIVETYPLWKSITFIISLTVTWISYVFMINGIVKDQWHMQESELHNKIIKSRFIRLREGNVAMIFRIITLNFYEWLLLFNLIRETDMCYIANGTASGDYTKYVQIPKEEIKEDINTLIDNLYIKITNEIEKLNEDEKYSKIFSEVTALKKETAKKILQRLFDEEKINKEDYDRIKTFI